VRFLRDKLLDVLEDLGIPHKGFILSAGVGQAPLTQRVPFLEVMDRLRADPRYGPKLSPHPWGAYLSFKNLNCPDQRALANVCLDFRARSGDLVSVKASLVFARVIRSSGEVITCLSLQALDTVSKTSLYEDQEEAVIDAA
jgi:hypothetical protein